MFCEPCERDDLAGAPNVVTIAAPRLSTCSGRDAWPLMLSQSPCGATIANGSVTASSTASAGEAVRRPPAADRPGERERHEHERPQLRGDRRAEQRPAGEMPAARPAAASAAVASSAGQRSKRERISEPASSGRERDVERRRRPERRDDGDEQHAAQRHQPRERGGVVAVQPGRQDEDGQRAGRVLDREVAVRDEAVMRIASAVLADRSASRRSGRAPRTDGARAPKRRGRPRPPRARPRRDQRTGRSARLGSSILDRRRRRLRLARESGATSASATNGKNHGEVEVEPVRQHELEADQHRARQRGHAERRAAAREPRERERADDEQHLQHALHEVQVGNAPWRGTGRQSQSENGESRPIWKLTVRS